MVFSNFVKDNFKAYDAQTTLKILNENSRIDFPDGKKLILVVGGNGAGKSTLMASLYQSKKLNLPCVNADLIERQLFNHISNDNSRAENSMNYTVSKINYLIDEGKSFAYESVFSHPSKLDLVKKAYKNGYKIIVFYVYTKDSNVNVKRVAKRVNEGGHNVATDKIVSRIPRVEANAKKLIEYCNVFYMFDNTKDLNFDKNLFLKENNQEKGL